MTLKDIYWSLPVPVQNLVVSTYGWRRQKQRYGGGFAKYFSQVMERQWWPEDKLQDYQILRLRGLVAYAMKNVKYFKETYSKLGISPNKLDSVKQLPIFEKETFRLNQHEVLSAEWRKRKLLEFHTTGSTGTPLTYFMERDDFHERMAFLSRQYAWAGLPFGSKTATLTGNLIISRKQSKPPFWRYNLPGNQLLMSSYHMTEANLPHYLAALRRFQPVVMEGYPSALYRLASHAGRSASQSGLRPLAIFVTAENLHEFQRSKIEDVFESKVYNYYGSSDGAPMITECSRGKLHLNLDCGIFEFLRPDGSDAEPGEMGEMIVTTFASRAMPVLRYRIRDMAMPSAEICDCGCNMPLVCEIGGRVDDMVFTRDRGWVGRLSQVLKVFPGSVREGQIIQESIDRIRVRLVCDTEKFHSDQVKSMISDMRRRLGEVVQIEVEFVDKIEKSAGGKFRYVICKIPKDQKLALWSGVPDK